MRPSHLLTRPSSQRSTGTGILARTLGLSCMIALAASAAAPAQSFTEITDGMTNVHHGASTWGDYDNDGDLDALVTGETAPPLYAFADIYQNSGGSFSPISAGLTAITGSHGVSGSAWGDFDNDGDLDVIVTGLIGPGVLTKLYRNTGGVFAPVTITPSSLIDVSISSVAWGDYDNDGDLDLFVSGYNSYPTMALYRNDGDNGSGGWNFTDVSPSAFTPKLGASASAWGDYDNDGDLDLAVSGYKMILVDGVTTIYRNDGGVLVNSGVTNLPKVGMGGLAWGDVNNDGWLDLVVTGNESVGMAPHFKVYTNGHTGTFALASSFTGLGNSSVTLGDYNNDGKLDIVAMGLTSWGDPMTFAYKGNGTGSFTLDGTSGLLDPFYGMYEGQTSFGDYDNDGRLDLIMTGRQVPTGDVFTRVYHNTTGVTANTAPTTPTGLTATAVSWNSITVQWSLSSDAQSPTATLHYNLKVVDLTAGTTVMSPMSNASGYRQVAQLGNTNHNSSWTIGGLTPGHTYQFSVQAIDQAYKASAMSSTISVTTTSDRPDVMIADCAADVGAEPNLSCSSYWTSPSIYVRTLQDGLLPGNDVHQTPVAGHRNWVYVKLKNIGPGLLPNGKVLVYFSKASTGLAWSANWAGYYVGSILYGDYIGAGTVSYLSGGGGSTIVEIPWDNVPNPASFSDPDAYHFCLLARFVAASDPMTVAETASTYDNTQKNNNIAWKNITVLRPGGIGPIGPIGPIELHNVRDYAVMTDLTFDVAGNANDNVLQHAEVWFDLGPELFQRWINGGQRGNGIEFNGQQNTVRIVAPHASLEGIMLDPDQQLTAHVRVVYPQNFDPSVAGNIYSMDLVQYGDGDNGGRVIVGGETYTIEMPSQPYGKATVGNTLSALLKLSAFPNPTSAATTISFTLPEESRITLGLYDVTGKLVRTLVPASMQKAGEHTIEWDGTTATGQAAPSGAYFYRLETTGGTAQGQIRITR